MSDYEYRADDRSLLTPALKAWLVRPSLALVPLAMPANLITIGASAFIWLALALSTTSSLSPTWWRSLAIAGCLVSFLVGDHLDGMQARRTRTSSALGDFLDHFFDTFNNGMLHLVLFLALPLVDPPLFIVMLGAMYLNHALVFCEHHKTGVIRFERVGPVELVAACAATIAFAPVPGWPATVHTVLWVAVPTEAIPILLSLRRIGRPDRYLAAHIVASLAVVVALLAGHAGLGAAFAVITFHSSAFVTHLLSARLLQRPVRRYNAAATVLLIGGAATAQPAALAGGLALCVGLIVHDVVAVWRRFGHQWRWTHPRPTPP